WQHGEALQLVRTVLLNLGGHRGPRSDHTHLSTQNVHELRQPIERVPAQNPAYVRYARILGDLEQHAVALVQVKHASLLPLSIGHHGAKFETGKPASIFP